MTDASLYLAIEIGGTKLQLAIGSGDGTFVALWRGTVDVARGGEGIREQIVHAVPEMLSEAKIERSRIVSAGIGFGGPVDDETQCVIKSHQIDGWTDFPLAKWLGDSLQLPCILGNDADVAGLAEAIHGAGKGVSPIFYITVGSGIGGGFIVDGQIYLAAGRGAAEIGHLRIPDQRQFADGAIHPLEQLASGWGIANYARRRLQQANEPSELRTLDASSLTTQNIALIASRGDPLASEILRESVKPLAEAIRSVIALLCPRRIVIGGGVSLIGESLFFAPLRERLKEIAFPPFAGLTEILPAQLGEEVVLHGAIEMARDARGRI